MFSKFTRRAHLVARRSLPHRHALTPLCSLARQPSPLLNLQRYRYSTQQRQPTAPQPTSATGQGMMDRFRQLGKEYGKTAAVVYISMSFTTFSMIYSAIWNGIDVERLLQDAWNKISGGKQVGEEAEDKTDFEKLEASKAVKTQEFSLQRVGTTFLVAFGVNKLLSPFKILATIAVTPRLVKWLRLR